MNVIYCAGEQGRVVLDSLRRNGVEGLRFVDDDDDLWGDRVDGVPVIGGLETLLGLDRDETRVVVGYGRIGGSRLELAEPIRAGGFDLFSVVDPDATVAETASVGAGTVVGGQSYVGPGVELGELVLVDTSANVSHDCALGDGVTVAPNATLAGGVTVGRDAYVGAGATVLDHVTVGPEAVVGAGAVVTEAVPEGVTVVGVPAKPLPEER